MTAAPETLSTTVEHRFSAAPARVFDAWLNPEMLARFMTPGPGMTVPKAETDPREGGRFDIVMKAGDDEIPHAGTYREISRHDRLVFTWESPFSIPDSTVTLTFTPDGDGTHLTLLHERFPSEESRDNHQGGWTAILARLEEVL